MKSVVAISGAEFEKDMLTMLETLEKWNFNIWKFYTVTEGHPLYAMSVALVRRHDLLKNLDLSLSKFENFAKAIEKSYQKVPYHSAVHGADVLQVGTMMP